MQIIKIGALWCPACLITNNNLDKILKKYPNINIINLDYDFDDEAKKYDVGETLPVLIFMKDNKEITRLIGEKTEKEIEEIVGDIYEK